MYLYVDDIVKLDIVEVLECGNFYNVVDGFLVFLNMIVVGI